MSQSKDFHLKLLNNLYDVVKNTPPFNDGKLSEENEELISTLKTLSDATTIDESMIESGQRAISRIVAQHPHLTPSVNRDLFWFFGGDCLHFMPDEEIEKFQQLDELSHDQENQQNPKTYEELRALVFDLH